MTISPLADRPTARGPETGWARARRLRGTGTGAAFRTCVPAVEPSGAAPAARGGPEGNIVRGDD
ncbi:hypothetical protein ACIRPQ_15815 [Streptomyces sp. NPDC101213]|uniref:hypothetical protein n=1 Tax=unclassified Streptomyces TaxID=2593676 RepID=UPI0036FE580A